MENTSFSDDEASEKARTRYFLDLFLKLLWTSLTLLALLGVLIPLTIFLGWWTFILPCLIGLLAGIAITAGVLTSLQNRALITRLLAVLTLPGLAVYLSFMAGNDPRAFDAASSVLMPFVVYALAALIGSLIIVKIWQNMPVRKKNNEEEQEPTPVLTPANKEPTSHEGSDLNKAA
jgi:MFS superfamily sulfate permease-like transporter